MKKFILFITAGIALLFLMPNAKAQTYDTTQYFGKMNYVFANVNKALITTGLLRDYGIDFLNLDNYTGSSGLHDSNYVGLDEWRMLYASMYSAQINNTAGMLAIDTINRLVNKYNYTSMPIAFTTLYYKYQSLKSNAVTAVQCAPIL